VDGSPLLIANAQPPELIQTSEGAFQCSATGSVRGKLTPIQPLALHETLNFTSRGDSVWFDSSTTRFMERSNCEKEQSDTKGKI